MDLFDRQAGNLSAMAGLGAQAGTVGQEELIHAAVSRKEAKMQQRVHSYTASVMGKIGHMMWADEFLELSGQTEAIAGSGIMVESSWTPEKREGDFWQYNFDIIPGSTNYESTEAKIGKIERAMEKLQQLYPMIQAAGGEIDVEALTRVYAEYLEIPEIQNIITFSQPSGEMGGVGGSEQGMPSNTTRNYVRRNVPTGGTPQARSQALQQSMYGNESQNQQNMLNESGA
jgi:ribosomal 30S subunit maturation factor RimM